ncbi:hypothetical protein BON22_4990 [Cyberlindnera fabianii]|uniref:Uncharacterized protein n=1 Tax=Cyberlindnera fabianii TaxID=36022 RepID=A0A1V2KZZ7_CYBFA|nr:hypothetical protein BON22_4990 [Cyberlindnera fabianii]
MYTVLQYFYFNKKSALTNFYIGISPDHMNSSNLVKNYSWELMLSSLDNELNLESIILRNITVIRSLMIDLSKVKEAMWGETLGMKYGKVLKQIVPQGVVKPTDIKLIPKHFHVYVRVAKFLADLEQLLTRNFGYLDKEIVDQDYWIVKYPRDVSLENVVKIVNLRLSGNILKIGEFIFKYIYEQELSFNIFKSLGQGLGEMNRLMEEEFATQ